MQMFSVERMGFVGFEIPYFDVQDQQEKKGVLVVDVAELSMAMEAVRETCTDSLSYMKALREFLCSLCSIPSYAFSMSMVEAISRISSKAVQDVKKKLEEIAPLEEPSDTDKTS